MKEKRNVDLSGGGVKITRIRSDKRSGSSITTRQSFSGTSIFAIILLIVFVVSFSHYIRTGVFFEFSFGSLINYLKTVPDVSIPLSSVNLHITADWVAFNFLRDFFNVIMSYFEMTITLCGMLLQGLIIIFYFVRLLFI